MHAVHSGFEARNARTHRVTPSIGCTWKPERDPVGNRSRPRCVLTEPERQVGECERRFDRTQGLARVDLQQLRGA
jgi:hypothetical protein